MWGGGGEGIVEGVGEGKGANRVKGERNRTVNGKLARVRGK